MKRYQEDVLIKKGFLYFLAPSFVVGMLSIFFPLFYALIPAHESGICLCSLQYLSIQHKLLPVGQRFFLTLNTGMFYGVNWIFLLLNIRMLYRIRHIKDRLKVREEMTYIVISWTVFCYM